MQIQEYPPTQTLPQSVGRNVIDVMNMDSLRKRCAHLKEIDTARNTLLDDLLRKLDDMQKTVDRDAFVMVLIDGDCMNFLNELVKRGEIGGEEAAKLLRRAVFDHLRYDEHFKHNYKIVIRVYANFRGLAKTYVNKNVLPTAAIFSDFVLGFNKAHPLCDFIDAGNHKEAADTKLKESINLCMYNVHCKQIIFGASADNGYASFLNSSFIGTDVSARLTLLKGPPFSSEFKQILSKLRWTEFDHIFRNESIANELDSQNVPLRKAVQEPTTMKVAFATAPEPEVYEKEHPACTADCDKKGLHYNQDSIETITSKICSAAKHGAGCVGEANKSKKEQLGACCSLSCLSVSKGLLQVSRNPTETEIATTLIEVTDECLERSPNTLDFGTVKQIAALRLSLKSNVFGKNKQNAWFVNSKNIIKYAVEKWVERTDNPPPKGATWMLPYFGEGHSPSSVMRSPSAKAWRAELKWKC